MMKIQNIGKRRIRLDKKVYVVPNQIIEVSNSVGKWAVRKHTDIINISPKRTWRPRPKIKPKVKNTIKLNLEVKENDIK